MAKKEKKKMVLLGDHDIGKTCLRGVIAKEEYYGENTGAGTIGMGSETLDIDHPTKAGEQLQFIM